MQTRNFARYDHIASIVLSATVLLGIAAFLPGNFLSGSVLKGYVLIVGTAAALVFWLVGRLIEGAFRIPWTPVLGSLGIFTAAYFVSALFSRAPYLSFFGEAFDQGTFVSLAMLAAVLFLASVLFGEKKRIFFFLQGFFALYALIALYQFVHIFLPSQTALGVFFSRVSTPVGLWTDFAYLSGGVLTACVLAAEFFKPPKKAMLFLYCVAPLALFFVVLSNIFLVWVLAGASALVILVYKLLATRSLEEKPFPVMAFVLVLVSLFFLMANSLFGGFLANLLQASFTSVNPSFVSTLHVAQSSLHAHLLVGAGPNRFFHEWIVYHPLSVNASTLWGTPFSSGASFFLTAAVLGGLLSILGCILFVASYAYESVRLVFAPAPEVSENHFVFALFLLSAYFFAVLLFASPGLSIIMCGFFFAGLLFAELSAEKRIPERSFPFLQDYRSGFFSILLIVLFAMLSVAAVSAATGRFVSMVYFQKGTNDAADGATALADQRFAQAISLSDLPVYERARALLAEQSIQQTLNAASSSTPPDALNSQVQNEVSIGNAAALRAVAIDPTDPDNYLALGDFMGLAAELKISSAFNTAHDAYAQSIALAPNYPLSYLDMAQLYYGSGDYNDANDYLRQALAKKSNYTEAFFLSSAIDSANGDNVSALAELKSAVNLDPANPDAYYQLGLLEYQTGDYQDADSAFSVALNLSSSDLNALYYLGLADMKTGNTDEAETILSALSKRFPGNADIAAALAELNAPASAPASGSAGKTSSKSSPAQAQ